MAARYIIRKLYPSAVPVFHSSTTNTAKNLVFITGWAGAERRNLRRLIEYYNSLGYGVVSHVMPLATFGFVRDFIDDWVSEEINHRLQDKTGFLVHLYSNNGAFNYSALSMKQLIPTPRLVIWDSSPYLWYHIPADKLWKVCIEFSGVIVSNILKRPQYRHAVLTPIIFPTLMVLFSAANIITAIQGKYHIVPKLIEYNIYLRDKMPVVPTVFIYSLGDRLVTSDKVEDFIGELKKRDFTIAAKVFGEDVQHTSSFFVKPAEYKEFIETYLRKYLA